MKKYLANLTPYKEQGYCNKIYISKINNRQYIVRELLNKEVDRESEYKIQQLSFKLGFAPKIIVYDENHMVSEFIEGAHLATLSRSRLWQLSLILKKLHKIKVRSAKMDLKNLLSYKDYHLIHSLQKFRSNPALTHNDLNPKNIIFADKIYLIDFEYAMIGDIYFDLASIIVEFDLNLNQERYFLQHYFRNKKPDLKKLTLYKEIYRKGVNQWFKKFGYNTKKISKRK